MANVKLMQDPKTTKIQLEQADWNALEELAYATRTSVNEQMRRAIAAYLAKRNRKTSASAPATTARASA